MAPGLELGVLLGGLDIAALTATGLVEVLRARARQLSHEQAQLLAVMAEVGLCDPHAGHDEVARVAQASEFAADEIRAALAWARNAAPCRFAIVVKQLVQRCEREPERFGDPGTLVGLWLVFS